MVPNLNPVKYCRQIYNHELDTLAIKIWVRR